MIQRPLKNQNTVFYKNVEEVKYFQKTSYFYKFTVNCNTLRQSIFPIYLMILLQRVLVNLILLPRCCFTSYWSYKIFFKYSKTKIFYVSSSFVYFNECLAFPLSKRNQMGNIALSLIDLYKSFSFTFLLFQVIKLREVT